MTARYPMGGNWKGGIQSRTSLGITYRYQAFGPPAAGYRGVGGRGFTRGGGPPTIGARSRPMRVNIAGGRGR